MRGKIILKIKNIFYLIHLKKKTETKKDSAVARANASIYNTLMELARGFSHVLSTH